MPVVKLQNVSKIYQLGSLKIVAIKNVSLSIEKGDFAAIMGPSGSGKSTLMHLIGCLDKPTRGEISIDGEKITSLSEDELSHIRNKKIGFVFQNYNLLQRTNALDNISLPLIYQDIKKNERERKAKEILVKLGLGDRLNHFPSQLSGGQQQRVAIGRALVTNPSIILADEPTGNLDSKSGKEILEILKKLNKEGNTIIVVTHEESVAKSAKRIIKLKDGEIVKN